MDQQKHKLLSRLKRQSQWISTIEQNLVNQDKRFFWYRLFSFSTAWVGAILTRIFFPGSIWVIVFIFFMLVFFIVVLFHRKLDAVRLRYQNAHRYVEDQISRLSLNWEQIPASAVPDLSPKHAFAADLNLSGEKSLLQLLNVTQTIGGEKRLQDWLLFPQLDQDHIQQRQMLVRELRDLPGFRRHYVASNQNQRWDDVPFRNWILSTQQASSINVWLWVLSILALTNLTLFVLALLQIIQPIWQFGLILYAAIYFYKYRDYKDLFSEAYVLNQSLTTIKGTLIFLEKYPYAQNGNLKKVMSGLTHTDSKPSKILKKIAWVTSAASLQNNQILWLLINIFVPWDLWFAKILSGLKARLANFLPGWLDAWYEVDALVSLSNFAYLNPEYHFPQITAIADQQSESLFEVRDLGHPLIHSDNKVTNHFTIPQSGQVMLITGSNMSGKSTFLRTLGINLVLAYAGAPVNATVMNVGLMRLFSCIQVSDSLADGFSYFYAEVRRLKLLLDLLAKDEELPVFYLIDEIFRGTNNHERRIGSQSYLRALVKAWGSGVISTHDLELAKLSDAYSNILNFHFRDNVRDGKMIFDYQLRPGPSPSTNALKIMKNEGLPVDSDL
jgi:ABC-type multidrug transport system fused ATPase/permease subunit